MNVLDGVAKNYEKQIESDTGEQLLTMYFNKNNVRARLKRQGLGFINGVLEKEKVYK